MAVISFFGGYAYHFLMPVCWQLPWF